MVKYRKDFVTNSSSVCYVCEISGDSDGGSDCVGIEEYGFYCCERGHTFCSEYVIDNPYEPTKEQVVLLLKDKVEYYGRWKDDRVEKVNELIQKIEAEEDESKLDRLLMDANEYYDVYAGELPKIFCPICQMKHFKQDELFKYALKVIGVSKESLEKSISVRFADYDEFKEYIK